MSKTVPSRTSRRLGIARLASRLRERRESVSRRPWMVVGVVVLTMVLLAGLARPFVFAHLQAIAVLDLMANKPVPAPLRASVGAAVGTDEVTIPTRNGAIRARMYTPVGKKDAPALMVLHGVHHLGMDEPRLIAFATAMAACGIRVLTPELPEIKDYHVNTRSIATIGDAAEWLARQSGGKSVGVMGLSFSGSLSLLAAADPRWRPSIRFVVAIGSEDEMSHVADFYRTGVDPRPGGGEELLAPHEYGALVLEYDHLEDFAPKNDLPALRAVLRAHLYEDVAAEKAAMAMLTPAQVDEAKVLMDTNSPVTRSKLAAAETRHVQDMAGISPHGHMAQMTTPVYLLHGEADNIIPSAETQWMSAEIPSETLQASLISPVLSHLDMDGKEPSFADQMRLVHFFALVLRAAEKR